MQNRTDSGSPCFSILKQTWMFPLNDNAIKVAKCTIYEIKSYNIFRFSCLFPIFLSFPSIIWTDKQD